MTRAKRTPVRLDVHVTLSEEQLEKILDALDKATEALYGKKVEE